MAGADEGAGRRRKSTEEALRDTTAYLRLLQQVAVAANEAATADHALQVCLDAVCALTGWPVGHVYLAAGPPTGDLVPTAVWHLDDPQRFDTFRRVTEATRLPSGIGLPGRVHASGQPLWVVDVTQDANFPRARVATDIGVKAAFGFPVLVGKEVAAVLEFFAPDPIEPDEALLEVMGQVGTQLGRVIERERAGEALRQSEARYRLMFEHCPVPMWVFDLGTLKFLAVNDAAVRYYGYSREEFLSMTIKDIRPAEDVPRLMQTVAKLAPGFDVVKGHWRHRKKDGSIIDVEITSYGVPFEGRHAHLVLVQPVAEPRRAQTAWGSVPEVIA